MSNITELNILSTKLKQLTDDPHPGLHTWHAAVHDLIDKIAAFHKDE